MTISPDHPYWHVRSLVLAQPVVAQLAVSYYRYVPQTVADQRSLRVVSREQFLSAAEMECLIGDAGPQREFAFHSLVTLQSGQQCHIPMIDMATSAKAQLSKLAMFVDPALFGEFVWFASGRSFHGYGTRLLPTDMWVRLMGALLLSNQKDLKPMVDPRWIGHRLLAGYSALRWTKNTGFYLGLPTLLVSSSARVLEPETSVLELA